MDLIVNLIFFGIILHSMYLDGKERKRVNDRLNEIEKEMNYLSNEDEVNTLSFNAIFDRLEKLEENNLCQE